MKKLCFFLLTLITGIVSLHAQDSSQRIFSELAKIKDVTSIYVSGAMMKYGLSQVTDNIKMDSTKFSIKEIQNPGGIEILAGESVQSAAKLRASAAGLLNANNTTMLVEVNEGPDCVKIFSPSQLADGKIKDIIIEVSEGKSEYTLIYIHGDIII